MQRPEIKLFVGSFLVLGLVYALAMPATALGGTRPGVSSQASNGAFYTSFSEATSISAEVVVPTVDCSGNPAGTTAGQDAEVQLYQAFEDGESGMETADVRAYCNGTTSAYSTEFIVNDVSSESETYSPAKVAVSPGNLVLLELTAKKAGAKLEIVDESTHKQASETGAGFVGNDGPQVGVGAPTSNGSGGVMSKGTVADSTTTTPIAGPVPSSAIKFDDVEIDGAPLADFSGLSSTYWTTNGESSGTTVATPSAITSGGKDFKVTITA